ncbi:hypothetical protein SDC9_115200 [bioreactor metagenome]|uniref:Uncharacterized protein n=1 Tax=bioreactor metagenome TaxID=1076179 RepID=A0A645BS69_9ZZZZ
MIDDGFLVWHRTRVGRGARTGVGGTRCGRTITFNLFNGPIPIGVRKQARNIAKVHDRKVCFTFLFSKPGSAADNLLKFSHGADHLIKNNQLGHLAVGTGGEQL